MKIANFQVGCVRRSLLVILSLVLLCGLTGFGFIGCSSSQATRAVDPLAQIQVRPSELSFGDMEVGSSTSLTVTVENTGTADLTLRSVSIESTAVGVFTLMEGGDPVRVIAPGDSQEVRVRYEPMSSGMMTGALRIGTDLVATPEVTITLDGSGLVVPAPQLSVLPAEVMFSELPVGQRELVMVTLSNTGNADLIITALSIESPHAETFSLDGVPILPVMIAPGVDLTLGIICEPTSPGAKSGILRVQSNSVGGVETTIRLSGTSLALPTPQMEVSPLTLSYGEVEVGQSQTADVTLSNSGDADLTVSELTVESVDPVIFHLGADAPSLPATVAPGGLLTVAIMFEPIAAGAVTGQLHIAGDAPDNPTAEIELDGRGMTVPQAIVSPLALEFKDVKTGQGQTLEVQLANRGSGNLRVTSLLLEGESPTEFAISTAPSLPLVLNPDEQLAVGVSYLPSQAGRHTASFRILTDDPLMPEVVVLVEGSSVRVPVVTVSLLSTPAHLVSGGDALVQIEVDPETPLARLQVLLNGADVTPSFRLVTSTVSSANQLLRGHVSGLSLGDHTLTVAVLDGEQVPIDTAGSTITLTNWPSSGPLISGPHQTPFFCQTDQFNIGPELGKLGDPIDGDCSVSPRVDFVYRSTDGQFKALGDPGERPDDLSQVMTTTGESVPYIVRLETGTVNRSLYQTAVLASSLDGAPDPWQSAPGWNGRLVYKFGGGCRGGWYQQGNYTDNVLDHMMLSQGYATASASLNVFRNNCNTLLAAETMMMVKEHFVERNGPPQHTIGWGCSGGSYQAHFIADNYPGLLDGIIPQCSFPEVAFATTHTASDARLLEAYFNSRATVAWTPEARRAVTGFGVSGHLAALSQAAARIDPLPDRPERPSAEFSPVVPSDVRYDPVVNPTGARATIYDHTVAVYGREVGTGFARRPLDNVGIQYGLRALNGGDLSKAQFLDLNDRIGGFDQDATLIDARTIANPAATRRAYESGQLLNGGGGLASAPILDIDVIYSDLKAEGDVHMKFHHFSTRERLRLANGRSDNHVMWSGAGGRVSDEAGPSRLGGVLRQGLALMDTWLTRIQADTSDTTAADKVIRNKPEELVDGCWSRDFPFRFIEERQEFGGIGTSTCNDFYPAFESPRMVAGGPLANDIVKCQLKPVDLNDYVVPFDSDEVERLHRIFPDGVCDWDQRGVGQQPLRGLWLSFGPSPVNRVDVDEGE